MNAWRLAILALWLVSGFAMPVQAQRPGLPDNALTDLLAQARDMCASADKDRLARVLCSGRIRIGVRENYPLFAERTGDARSGYEIDVARAIAGKLGVDVEFVRVNAATRIAMLAEDRIDLVIATMGHNSQRDTQARFIRPHYYQSETVIVGPRAAVVASWLDIPQRTVCATVGNGSNAELVTHEARLMLFDDASALADRLRDGTCQLAAQDDSFFAAYFVEPAFRAAYSLKFGFAEVPWGMAVARTGSERLANAIDLISQTFHRDGVFLDLARQHRIGTSFLESQSVLWKRLDCDTPAGTANPACILPPRHGNLPPTPFARSVAAFETWVAAHLGVDLALPMLKTAPAWSLFTRGVINSLILVVGTLAATLAVALAMGTMLGSRWRPVRWSAQALTVTLQSSPVVLTLVIASALAQALFPYSSAVALGAAMTALGLGNGCNAGQAIAEAMATLRAEGARHVFRRALGRSSAQLVSFLVNAAKGTPIASFIGAPELLSSLTDITSFSAGRVTTYWLLLLFYIAGVMVVVWACGRLQARLARSEAFR